MFRRGVDSGIMSFGVIWFESSNYVCRFTKHELGLDSVNDLGRGPKSFTERTLNTLNLPCVVLTGKMIHNQKTRVPIWLFTQV